MSNVLLEVLGVAAAQEIWIHILGFAVIVLGYYYIQLGKNNVVAFFKWSYPVRIAQILFFAGLVVLKGAPVILIGVAAVETFILHVVFNMMMPKGHGLICSIFRPSKILRNDYSNC